MLLGRCVVIPANSTVGDVRAPKTPLANLLAPTGITTPDNAVAKAKFWHAAIMESVSKCSLDHCLAVSKTFPRQKLLLECPVWIAKYNGAAANVLRSIDGYASFF